MRHLRARRKYRLTLLTLLMLSSMLLTESRIEALMPELKAVAEARVERALGGGSALVIGNVDGGILQPIVLNGVRIERARGQALFQSLVIDKIRTNYRIWDLLRMKAAPEASEILEKGSTVYVNFSLRGGKVSGFAGIEGDLVQSRASGYVNLPGEGKIEFIWAVKGDNFDLALYPSSGALRVICTVSDGGVVDAAFRIDHVKLRGVDISCAGRISNRMSGPGGFGSVEGEVVTSDLVLNGIAVPDMKASYISSGGVLRINELKLANGLGLRGSVSLGRPRAADLAITADSVNLNRLFLTLGVKDAASVLTGTLSGRFAVKVRGDRTRLDSTFDIRQGTAGTFDFSHLTASLEGELPFLKIEDARMYRRSGYLAVAGEIDVTKAGTPLFFKDVKLVTDDNAIAWDQWGSVERNGSEEVNMARSLNPDVDVRYRKLVGGARIDESSRDGDRMKLEYKLTQNESLGVSVEKDRSFVGFEHRDEF